MATINQLVDRMKSRLARRAFTNFDTILIDELTHAQQEVLEKDAILPNFLIYKTANIVQSGAHSSLALSAGELARFLRPLSKTDIPSLEYLGSDGKWVAVPRFDSWNVLYQRYPGTGEKPVGYYWDGNVVGTFDLQPTPTTDVTYRARFYRGDATVPAVGATTLWSTHAGDYLMHTAGVEVATYLRDENALSYFSSKRQEAFERFKRQITAQEMADTDLVMGDD